MKKIILCGANGKMGHVIRNIVAADKDCEIVAGIDKNTEAADFPVYSDLTVSRKKQMSLLIFQIPRCLIHFLNIQRIRKFPLLLQPQVLMTSKKSKLKMHLKNAECSSHTI